MTAPLVGSHVFLSRKPFYKPEVCGIDWPHPCWGVFGSNEMLDIVWYPYEPVHFDPSFTAMDGMVLEVITISGMRVGEVLIVNPGGATFAPVE